MNTWVKDDGGRAAAGYKGNAGDCVARAIAIATGLPYREVYKALWAGLKAHAGKRRDKTARSIQRGGGRRGTTPRNGIHLDITRPYLESLGWVWFPTMPIGRNCKVRLRADELPPGRLIVAVRQHVVAVIDGVVHDNHDCTYGGHRCVYGYFRKACNDCR